VKKNATHSVIIAMNEAIQSGLKHTFFKDGLEADTHDLSPAEAYREGWRDAWLTMADDLSEIVKRASDKQARMT
jgi:hypothetical protein